MTHQCPDCGATHRQRRKSDEERIADLEEEIQRLRAQLLDALTRPATIYPYVPYVPCHRPHLDWQWTWTTTTSGLQLEGGEPNDLGT